MARIHYHQVHHHLNRLLLTAAPPPSASGPKPTNNSYDADANLDSNMVIILAALLCALICALGLNSIVRCFLRCSQRFSFEENNPDRVGSRTGLKKEALSQIPVAAYEAGGVGIRSATTECTICLGEFVEGEKLRVLPKCRHGFHVKCIDAWLVSHSSCPICRQLLLFEGAVNSGTVNSGGVEEGQVRI